MAKRVLVADDSPTIRKIVELCLKDHGIEVVSAASGAEAIEKMKASAHDLILADAVMPGPDGYELCERVKGGEFGQAVPVVILADVFEPVDTDRVSACGADGQITKPFDARTLQLMVSDQMGIDPPTARQDSMAALPSGDGTQARGLTEAEIDAVARRAVAMMSADVVREVVWEIVPEMSELLIKEKMQGR